MWMSNLLPTLYVVLAEGQMVGGLEGWRVGCLKAEDGRLKTEAMRGRADARMRSKAEDGRADGWKV